jgi:hypothetical protein
VPDIVRSWSGARDDDGDGDGDIIDAEIVETPPPTVAPAAQAAEPTPAQPPEPPPAPEPTDTAARSIPAAPPIWGTPPVPNVPVDPITDYTAQGIPTFAYLQDKVERRYATAVGSHELAEAVIPEVAEASKRREQLAKSAQERLEEIRRSLHPED